MPVDADILKSAVRQSVGAILPSGRVKSVTVEDGEETDEIRVFIEVSKAKDKLPKDIVLTIVDAASKAVFESGEERFPVVFAQFAPTQSFAA